MKKIFLTALLSSLLGATAVFAHAQDSAASNAEVTAAPAPTVEITDHKVGTGTEAQIGNWVEVHYTGWLFKPLGKNQRGKEFDSSRNGSPLRFQLGAKRVIKGWEQGILGMKVGGKRTLVIPPELAYGKRGAPGAIPPDATLIFDVELVSVE